MKNLQNEFQNNMVDIQNNHINNTNYMNFQHQNQMLINQQNF